VERGLDEPPLAQPDAALGQQEPVAERPREQTDAGALDEVAAPRDQDLLDGVRVVDEQPAIRPEAQRHDVAVVTRARRVEAELIARQVYACAPQADGSVVVPEALRAFMGVERITKRA